MNLGAWMILADTSAWVEHDRRTESTADERLTRLLVADPRQLAVTEPVVMEVLAGATSDDRGDVLRRLLGRATLLRLDPVSDFEAAARTYRRCRSVGFTPRGLLDCLVAVVAWRRGAAILTWDSDLLRIARVLGVDVDPASLPG